VKQKARLLWIGVLTGCCVLLCAFPALAGEGDHWSIFASIIPENTLQNFQAAWGKTWIAGEEQPARIMHIVMAVVAFILVLIGATVASRKFKKTGDEAVLPEQSFGIFTFFELVSDALLGSMTEIMGAKHARKFFPLIMSLALFILCGNLLGLVPGFLPATDNLNTTIALGFIVFFVTHIYGVREQGFVHYFAHFLGPIRSWYALPLMILMLAIELISHIARPVSLGIRLFGNMFGDHKVVGIFLAFSIPLLPLPMMVLGLIVCTVQTLVFCLLSVAYIALAVAEADEH